MTIEINMSFKELKELAMARIKELYPDHEISAMTVSGVDISPNTLTSKFSGFSFVLNPPKGV